MTEEFDNLPQQEAELPNTAPQDPPGRPGRDLFEWFQVIMYCILTAVVLFNCVARLTRVDGPSMDNTLQHGELMVVWSLGYEPKAGDIVILNDTTAKFLKDRAIVKRIIATGGQTVDIDYATNTVYVDGVALDEPYIKEEMIQPSSYMMLNTHWEVPEGSIFVMGDNRNESTDSRYDELGTIANEHVLGKVVLALWPPAKFGLL